MILPAYMSSAISTERNTFVLMLAELLYDKSANMKCEAVITSQQGNGSATTCILASSAIAPLSAAAAHC